MPRLMKKSSILQKKAKKYHEHENFYYDKFYFRLIKVLTFTYHQILSTCCNEDKTFNELNCLQNAFYCQL